MNIPICTASMTSQTYAIKAERALSGAVIPCKVVKLDAEKSHRGCSYGIEFSCAQRENVERVLASKGIKPKHYYRGDEEI